MIYFWSLAQVFICWLSLCDRIAVTVSLMLLLFFLRKRGVSKWGIWGGLAIGAALLFSGLLVGPTWVQQIQAAVFVAVIWISWALFGMHTDSHLLETRARRFLEARPKPLVLLEKEQLSDVLFLLRFALPDGYSSGVGTGQHVRLLCTNPSQNCANWNGKVNPEKNAAVVSRSYTPVSSTTSATLDLVVRAYQSDAERGFPQGGKASTFLTEQLRVNDELLISGPHGHRVYIGNGLFRVGAQQVQARRCAAVVGGSGVTPALALLQELRQEHATPLKNMTQELGQPSSIEDVSVVQVTRSRNEALPMAMFHIDQAPPCHLCNVVTGTLAGDQPIAEKGVAATTCYGKLTKEIIQSHLPAPGEDVVVLLCGPRGFVEDLCQPLLSSHGYKHVVVLW